MPSIINRQNEKFKIHTECILQKEIIYIYNLPF